MAVELFEHQQKAIDEMHNGCILVGGVGTGKTMTALGYFFTKICGGVINDIASLRTPRDLYVITTAKKRDDLDWIKEAAAFGISNESAYSPEGVRITVDSWQNIAKYVDVEEAFFIFDEQKVVGNGTWVKSFLEISKNNRWVLLSATPGDTWMDYLPVFLANGFYKNRTEFKLRHVKYKPFAKFPQIERYLEVGKLARYRNQILVEMPFDRKTVRHESSVPVEYDFEDYVKVYEKRWHIYEDRPIKNDTEGFGVARKVVNSDPSRMERVREVLKEKDRVIIFYNYDYELEALRTLYKDYTVAEWNGHKHEPVPTGESWVYLVQYLAGAEGWNCVETDTVLFYSLNFSWKITEQCKGRIDRLNTPFKDLYYIFLVSKSNIDRAILRALRTKEDFNVLSFVAGKYDDDLEEV